jgi:hypothetical protein
MSAHFSRYLTWYSRSLAAARACSSAEANFSCARFLEGGAGGGIRNAHRGRTRHVPLHAQTRLFIACQMSLLTGEKSKKKKLDRGGGVILGLVECEQGRLERVRHGGLVMKG